MGVYKGRCTTLPDPTAPNCSSLTAARFALVLHGSVGPSRRSPYMKADELFRLGHDLPESAFGDVTRVHAHLRAYLLEPSGGEAAWDTFLHSTVPSHAVQRTLLRLYRPLAHRFSNYTLSWQPRIDALCDEDCKRRDGHVEVSRWLSAAAALRLVFRAEETTSGRSYAAVYLTRFDVLLWATIDLRTYCVGRARGDVVYTNHCHPPFQTSHGPGGAPADFHLVLSSHQARGVANVTHHLARFDFFLEWGPEFPRGLGDRRNRLLTQFLMQVGNARRVKPDHVVCARHETNLRKAVYGNPHQYAQCCATTEPRNNCRHYPPRPIV